MKVLVTGANGFVGRAVVEIISQNPSVDVIAACRNDSDFPNNVHLSKVNCIDRYTDWSDALSDVDVVVHCAAKAHVLGGANEESDVEMKEVNFHGSINLANQAASSGVRRFVFISSISVYGCDFSDVVIDEGSPVNPTSCYGRTKLEAESDLRRISEGSGMDVVIIRPPLVYGNGAPGNFGLLVRTLERSIPLPFLLTDNRRSFLYRNNLAHFVEVCIEHPCAANETFVVSDGKDLSTSELIKLLSRGLGKRFTLFPVPVVVLGLLASSLGKKRMYFQLCKSLQLDISKAKNLLGWVPELSPEDAVPRSVKSFSAD